MKSFNLIKNKMSIKKAKVSQSLQNNKIIFLKWPEPSLDFILKSSYCLNVEPYEKQYYALEKIISKNRYGPKHNKIILKLELQTLKIIWDHL